MEFWDVLDSSGNPIGETVARGKVTLSSGEYHLAVHIWIISDDGMFLIQQRSDSKKLMPGEWAATGGAAISGEDSFTAASRELLEELGISSTEKTLKFVERVKRKNSFVDIWVTRQNVELKKLKLQKTEVARAKWVTEDCLKTMIKEGKFHDYGKYYWSVVFGACRDKAKI